MISDFQFSISIYVLDTPVGVNIVSLKLLMKKKSFIKIYF